MERTWHTLLAQIRAHAAKGDVVATLEACRRLAESDVPDAKQIRLRHVEETNMRHGANADPEKICRTIMDILAIKIDAVQPRQEIFQILLHAERLLPLIELDESDTNKRKILKIRYTLIRRLVAIKELDTALDRSWSLLSCILECDVRAGFVSTRATTVCQRHKNDELFMSISFGVLLNIMTILTHSAEITMPRMHQIVEVSNVITSVTEALSTAKPGINERHAGTIISTSLRCMAHLSDSNVHGTEVRESKRRFLSTIMTCVQHSQLSHQFVFDTCNKLLRYVEFVELLPTLYKLVPCVGYSDCDKTVSQFCQQLTAKAIGLGAQQASERVLRKMLQVQKRPCCIDLALAALLSTPKSIFEVELSTYLRRATEYLNNIPACMRQEELRIIGMLTTTLARQIHKLANYFHVSENRNLSILAQDVQAFAGSAVRIVHMLVDKPEYTQVCRNVSNVIVATLLFAAQLEVCSSSTGSPRGQQPSLLDELLRMLDDVMHKTLVNTEENRRAIHSAAKNAHGAGLQDLAERLYVMNFSFVETSNVDSIHITDGCEIHRRMRVVMEFFAQTGRPTQGIDFMLLNSAVFLRDGAAFRTLVLMYTDAITKNGMEDRQQPLVFRLKDEISGNDKVFELLIAESQVYASFDTSQFKFHVLQSALISHALSMLSHSTRKETTGAIHCLSRLMELQSSTRLGISSSCATPGCPICDVSAMIKLCRKSVNIIKKNVSSVEIRCAAVVDITCRTCLGIVCRDRYGANLSGSLMQEMLDICDIKDACNRVENFAAEDAKMIDRMCDSLRNVCEIMNLHGSMYLSQQLLFLGDITPTSYITSIVLSPMPAPQVKGHLQFPLRAPKAIRSVEWHRIHSICLRARIAAERENFVTAYAYAEYALSALRSKLTSKQHLADKSQSASTWFSCGHYIVALCLHAIICAEIGMFATSVSSIQEAISLAQLVSSDPLLAAVYLTAARVYHRSAQYENCVNMIKMCTTKYDSNTSLHGRWLTYLDAQTYRYGTALRTCIHSMCCIDCQREDEGQTLSLSVTKQLLPDKLSRSDVKQSGDQKFKTDHMHTISSQHAYWDSQFRHLLVKLDCHRILASSVSDSVSVICRIEAMILNDRWCQSKCFARILLCKLCIQCANIQVTKPCAATMAEFKQNSRELLWHYRNSPLNLAFVALKILPILADDTTMSVHGMTSFMHCHYGSVLRAQHFAFLARKVLMKQEPLHISSMNSATIEYGYHAAAYNQLEFSHPEEFGIYPSGISESHILLDFPVVTVGTLQRTTTEGGDSSHCLDLIITRSDDGDHQSSSSVCIRLETEALRAILCDFATITEERQHNIPQPSVDRSSKVHWWQQRLELDSHLEKLLLCMEHEVLGPWKVMFVGNPIDADVRTYVKGLVNEVESWLAFRGYKMSHHMLQCTYLLLTGIECLSDEEFCTGLLSLAMAQSNAPSIHLSHFQQTLSNTRMWTEACDLATGLRQRIDDKSRESTSANTKIKRRPLLIVMDENVKHVPWESMPICSSQRLYRIPSIAMARAIYTVQQNFNSRRIELNKSYFVLNPMGDLVKTQAQLDPILKRTGWNGTVGTLPNIAELTCALQDSGLYLYFGHGGGREIYKRVPTESLSFRAAAILMGCSSGSYDNTDSSSDASVAIMYLFADAPVVLGNLWDVTDSDIDRLSVRLLNEWLSGEQQIECAYKCLAHTVNSSRGACQLRYLVGAAPVLYGIPKAI